MPALQKGQTINPLLYCMNFKKINNITGWIICAIACLVYLLTAEASGSFWDTGEFIASAYKLQLPHPPGAPLFTLRDGPEKK